MDSAIISIIVALITGGLTLVGTIMTVMATSRKQANDFRVELAVMNTKIETLTAEVRKHNDFATRVPTIERDIKHIYYEIDEIKRGQQA